MRKRAPTGSRRFPETKQLYWKASQLPPPVLIYLLHLVTVELSEEAGDHMRGNHPAAGPKETEARALAGEAGGAVRPLCTRACQPGSE
jgi:hypothetical protein